MTHYIKTPTRFKIFTDPKKYRVMVSILTRIYGRVDHGLYLGAI